MTLQRMLKPSINSYTSANHLTWANLKLKLGHRRTKTRLRMRSKILVVEATQWSTRTTEQQRLAFYGYANSCSLSWKPSKMPW